MKDHLTVAEGRYNYHLAWYLADEEDIGAYVGESHLVGKEPDRASQPDEWEVWTANRIAREDPDHDEDEMGFYWESKAAAQRVLTKINLALKAKRPLFDWEQKALDAGWKPPKGWNGKA